MSIRRRYGEVLTSSRSEVARACAERVQQSSPRYRRRPMEEIERTALGVVDGLVAAVTVGNFEGLQETLSDVAGRRVAMGFEGSEVQRALLLGCEAIFPVLEKAFGDRAQDLVWCVTQTERAIHRGLVLLNEALEEADAEDVRALGAAAEARLGAVLSALGWGAVAVNAHLVVVWADERAQSARHGAISPGEAYVYDGEKTEDAPGAAGPALLAAALETGTVQRSEAQVEGDIWLAIPIKSEDGEFVEIVGLLGASSPADSDTP